MNSALEQAEKKKKTFDMMVSMHCQMRDIYKRLGSLFDCFQILTTVLLCGVTFFDFKQIPEFANLDFGIVMGFISITLFALTLINQRLDFKKHTEQHKLAGNLYVKAKIDLEQKILIWNACNADSKEIINYINNIYQELIELTPIPEKKFHKLKHHHQYKVEFSKFLDEHKSELWFCCKLKFLFKR